MPDIERFFPNSQVMTIEESGHNVHVENKPAFVSAVTYFAEDVLGENARS